MNNRELLQALKDGKLLIRDLLPTKFFVFSEFKDKNLWSSSQYGEISKSQMDKRIKEIEASNERRTSLGIESDMVIIVHSSPVDIIRLDF
jgi:hypothetical protein